MLWKWCSRNSSTLKIRCQNHYCCVILIATITSHSRRQGVTKFTFTKRTKLITLNKCANYKLSLLRFTHQHFFNKFELGGELRVAFSRFIVCFLSESSLLPRVKKINKITDILVLKNGGTPLSQAAVRLDLFS